MLAASRFCAQASHWALSRDLGQTTSTAAASAIAGAAGINVIASFYLARRVFLLQLHAAGKFKWERCFQLLPIWLTAFC